MTTKQWLLDFWLSPVALAREKDSFWSRFDANDPAIAHTIEMLDKARRLVEQGPEEPTP